MSAGLFPVVAVECFYGCGHLERSLSPQAAHAAMEAHYAGAHPDGLERLARALDRPGRR